MADITLIPDPTQVELVRLTWSVTGGTAVGRAHASSSLCPVCGQHSERVHSWYQRQVADLPWLGIAVRLQLLVRRFFCDYVDCPRTIFTGRLPGIVAPYARRTMRLARLVELVGMLLGGNTGRRASDGLAGGLGCSHDIVLRVVRLASIPPNPSSVIFGMRSAGGPLPPRCLEGGHPTTKPREPAHTVAFVDDYCAHYRAVFPNVRQFEQFTHLELGLVAETKRKSLPRLAQTTKADPQALHHFLAQADWSVAALCVICLELTRQAVRERSFILFIDETGDRKKRQNDRLRRAPVYR